MPPNIRSPAGMSTTIPRSGPQFKVETTSCYRSSGSVPIPKPAQLHFNSFIKPLKKKKVVPPAPPAVHNVEPVYFEVVSEDAPQLSCDLHEPVITEPVLVEGAEQVVCIYAPEILELDAVPELPAKKSADVQHCRKHSRCHCNLFSKETDGFFTVAPSNVGVH